MKTALRFIGLFSLALWAAHARASTCSISSGASTATIQSTINSCGAGNTVSFAAGTYNITAELTLQCGLTYTGPTAVPATVLLIGSSLGIGTPIFNLNTNGSGPVTPCTAQTLIEYFNFQGADGISVQTPFTNLLIQYNQFTHIPGSSSVQTAGIGFYNYPTTVNTAAELTNSTITNNQIGDVNSCISPTNVMADTDSPEDYNGFCQGIIFYTSINGLAVTYNNFFHVAEGAHINCPQYAVQQFVCEPPGGAITQNLTIEYNDFNNIHRIAWEEQPQQSSGIVYAYNSEHDWVTPYFGSYGLSMACCYNGTIAQPNMTVASNVVVDNVPTQTGDFISYGFEAMGHLGTYNNNLLQMNLTNTGSTNAPGIAWGCGPLAAVNYNTVQGRWGGYIVTEGITGCGNLDTTPASLVGNVTGPTYSTFQSAAPSISPGSENFSGPFTVTLTDTGFSSTTALPNGNTTIWYTTDGSTPACNAGTSQAYTGPITITVSTTVKAIGMWGSINQPCTYPSGYGFVPSAVVSTTYASTGGVTLSSVALSNVGSVHSLVNGSTVQMTATCTYSNGSTTNCNTTDAFGNAVSSWNSSSSQVSISSTGLATAVSVGTAANLTAVVAGLTTATWAMAVTPAAATLSSVTLATTGGIPSLAPGGVNQLIATCLYSDSSTTNCGTTDSHGNVANLWVSTATGIATVSSTGLVTAVAAGSTSLSATVGEPMSTGLGNSTYDVTYANNPNFINATYAVPPAGGGTVNSCSIYTPAAAQTNGALVDCGLLLAPTPTTSATSWLCHATYTYSGSTGPGAFVSLPLTGCGTVSSPVWVASDTNAATSSLGYWDCGGTCGTTVPASGNGTYTAFFKAATYGTYTGLSSTMTAGGNVQVSAYANFTPAGGVTSNAVPLTVTAPPPTLVSASLTTAGNVNTLTVGATLQFAAKCVYSDSSTTDCTVADIHGNAVTVWATSDATKATIGAVGSANPGLVKAVAAGTPNISATIGSLSSATFALTTTNPAVTLTGISLATTGGVTGLFVGNTNALIATCLYSDGSTTNCTTTDSHGTVAGSYNSTTPAHATVNATSGLVRGIAPGITMLTATAGGLSSSAIPLTVLAVPSGTYIITITGPVAFSGTVRF